MLVNSGVGIVQTMLLMSGNSARHLARPPWSGWRSPSRLGFLLIPEHGALGAAVRLDGRRGRRERAGRGRPPGWRSVSRCSPARWAAAAVGAGGGAAVVAVLSALVAGRGVAGLALALVVLAVVAAGLLLDRRVRGTVRAAVTMLRPRPALMMLRPRPA